MSGRGVSRIVLGTLLLVVSPETARAGTLVPQSQDRSVEWTLVEFSGEYFCISPQSCQPISEQTDNSGDSDAAPDFGPFSSSLAGIVSQTSTIAPTLVTASGDHGATGSASLQQTPIPTFLVDTATWTSRSFFQLGFQLDEPSDYALSGHIAIRGGLSQSLARVRLEGPGAQEIFATQLFLDFDCLDPSCNDLQTTPIAVSGTLAPGSYTLEAEVDGETGTIISLGTMIAAAGTYEGHYDLTLDLTPEQVPALGGPALLGLGPAIALAGALCLLRPRRRALRRAA